MFTIFSYKKNIQINIDTISRKKLIVKFFYNNNSFLNYIGYYTFIYSKYPLKLNLYLQNKLLLSFIYTLLIAFLYFNK